MSFRERKRDREFQLELLRVQLVHERRVGLFTVEFAVGTSLLVFAVTFMLTFWRTEKELWWWLILLIYSVCAALYLWIATRVYDKLVTSEKEEIDRIRKEYLKEW